MHIIKETFASDPNFVSALDKACATIVNMKSGSRLSAKAPELVGETMRNRVFLRSKLFVSRSARPLL